MKSIISIFAALFFTVLLNSCNKEISTSPPEPVPQNSGKLFVASNPSGAKIYLNNKNTGYLTPDTVPYLDGGAYKLVTKLNLFKDSSEIVQIKKDSLTSVFLDYTANPTMKGYLNVDSYPQGADIIINDSVTGKVTPFEFSNVLPDTYNVVLKKTNYWNWSFTTTVKTDRTARIYGALEDTLLFVNYRTSNSGLPTNYLDGIAIDQDGNKWLVDSYSLMKFDDENWTSYTPDNSQYPGGNVNSIAAFGNEIWVATISGLIIYKNGSFEVLNTQSGLVSDYVYCGFKENENSIWVGTNLGLCHFDGATWTVYNTSNSGLPTNNISNINIDAANNLWLGTVGEGLVKYDGTDWSIYNSENSNLPVSNRITDIEIVNGSVIWISLRSLGKALAGGTAMYDGTQWTSFQSVPSNDVVSVIAQSPDLIWFCNIEAGLTKWDNGNWQTYLTSNSHIPSNRIVGTAIDRNGYKWIATAGGGLSKYKGN